MKVEQVKRLPLLLLLLQVNHLILIIKTFTIMGTRTRRTNTNANTNANENVLNANVVDVAETSANADTTATATEAQIVGQYGEDYTLKGVITKVMQSQGDNRITLVLDKEFAAYDNSGEETVSTMFGTNIYNLLNEVGAQVPELQLADAMALGKPLNPQIVALTLINAEIEVTRLYKEKGEEREFSENGEVYTNTCFVTRFKKIKTHINQVFVSMINNLIMTKPTLETVTGVNPFNV